MHVRPTASAWPHHKHFSRSFMTCLTNGFGCAWVFREIQERRVLVHDGTWSDIQASSREYYIIANLEQGINSVPMEELAILVEA